MNFYTVFRGKSKVAVFSGTQTIIPIEKEHQLLQNAELQFKDHAVLNIAFLEYEVHNVETKPARIQVFTPRFNFRKTSISD